MQALAYVYYETESGRRSSAKLLTHDEAFLIAVNIAKLSSVPRQILKDIPRPPNSASRDDERQRRVQAEEARPSLWLTQFAKVVVPPLNASLDCRVAVEVRP
jgi:hypothetical protein